MVFWLVGLGFVRSAWSCLFVLFFQLTEIAMYLKPKPNQTQNKPQQTHPNKTKPKPIYFAVTNSDNSGIVEVGSTNCVMTNYSYLPYLDEKPVVNMPAFLQHVLEH